ncbi:MULTISPECIES: branched-chain amino acid ABC transporter permease [Hyphomicrobiales]|uniref:Amino acid/amide ABC transporter membrane protein 1 (HAAT family) n=2 Tax=Hyphomicrobiales TaxID=356 RepID=A0A285V5S8_9HYPH|nr:MULTISPECIES: branched-chain amino acid ABC transporter permease [Hyphomicrobiales]KAB0564645.1 branched-chain amino acid ABC transporter permease [Brucella pituitosa]SOC48386.1 amino acid/amide ABC transporter membrane protein 1 (HAAT family) [Rhizobium subbaraonis]
MFLDLLISGLTLGGLYALVAMGLTLQYGVARIMNLAYGEFLIAASFLAWLFTAKFGINPITSLIVIIPLSFTFSWLVYRVLMVPLVRRSKAGAALEKDSILATFGLMFILQGILLVTFGGNYTSYSFLSVPVQILGTHVAANRLLVFISALLIGGSAYLLMKKTRFGVAVQAIASEPASAVLVGINVALVSALAFSTGGALVSASGVLISMFLPFSATMGVLFTMKALVVVIMGGVGNMKGCLVAGMLLGFVEAIVARLVDPGLTIVSNYALFLLVLIFLPKGLYGRASQ